MTAPTSSRVGPALLRQAAERATAAVEKVTTLRGASARKVAVAVLNAGGDMLRAEHALRLGARPDTPYLAACVAVLAGDLALFGLVAAGKSPRALRPAALAAMVARAGLFAYIQHRNRQIRQQIAAQLDAGGST